VLSELVLSLPRMIRHEKVGFLTFRMCSFGASVEIRTFSPLLGVREGRQAGTGNARDLVDSSFERSFHVETRPPVLVA
jgi:hypothetical protein